MKERSASERRSVTNVNVEVPQEIVQWMDSEAEEHETSRSGLVRMALKTLMRLKQAQKAPLLEARTARQTDSR